MGPFLSIIEHLHDLSMAKRKAEGSQRGGKAPARPPPARQPPPPPAQDDDSDDSDICEIVSPPPASRSNSTPRRRQQQQHAARPAAIAPRLPPAPGANLPFVQSQARASLLSMMPGMPAGLAMLPGPGAGFAYHQQQQELAQRMQAPSGSNPFMYAAPQLLPHAPGFQGRCFAGSAMSHTGASSGGASSGAGQLDSPRVRVREGAAAQEVKEEPEDPLCPRPDEVRMVGILRNHGVATPDAVHCLRQSGNRLEIALRYAMEMDNTRNENRQTDMARLESEKEKDRAAEQQREEDKILMVLGDVVPHFPQSILLDEEDGCTTFRQFVERLSAGDPKLCDFREKAISLLFLERDAFRHYPENDRQIRGYFHKLIGRLQNHFTERRTEEGEGATSETGAETAKDSDPSERVPKASCCGDNERDEETESLTATVQEEVRALRGILYDFPKTPGAVPDAFRDKRTAHNAATLERDGVEEDHDRNRLARTKDPVIIAVDD